MQQILSLRGDVEHSLNQHSPAVAVLRGWGGVWVCGVGWGVRGRLGGVWRVVAETICVHTVPG